MEREYGVVEGVPVKPSSSSGMGGGREGAGESGEGGDSDRGGPNAPRAGPSAVRRAAGGDDGDDDDDDDDEEDDWLDRDRELTFFESIFAFVFGRGDVNDDLEVRRWRAVGALLRVNKGCVFAEQVAPFLDSYLLSKEDQREVQNGLFAAVFDVIAHARRMFRKKADEARDASRMHEGYMLEVLTRFGGYAEASDDGQLIYVFPSLQVTTMANVASTSSAAASRALGRAIPAPTPSADLRARQTALGGRREDATCRCPRISEHLFDIRIPNRRRYGLQTSASAARAESATNHGPKSGTIP